MKKVLLSLLAIVALVGCGDKSDDLPTVYSPDEAKAAVKNTMDGFYNCLKKANDGGFANVLFDLLKDRKGDNESWAEYIGDVFYNQYDTQMANGDFNYEGLKGTYAWNFVSKKWDKTAESNNITWLFPSTASSTTNNGKAVLDGYQTKSYTTKNEKKEVPVKGHIVITIDNTKVAEMHLNNLEYKPFGEESFTPRALDVKIYTNPFTTTLKLNMPTDDEYAVDFSFSSPEGCATGLRAKVKLTTNDLSTITSIEQAIDNVSAVVMQDDLQVLAQADVKTVYNSGKKLSELTTEEINTYAKAEMFKKGVKIADLRHEKGNKDEVLIYFVFSDGSKVKAEEYIGDFEGKVKDIFKRFYTKN